MASTSDQNELDREKARTLRSSFVRITASLYVVQWCIFVAYAMPVGFFSSYWVRFGVTSAAFHGLLFWMLFLLRDYFEVIPGGVRLAKVNIANIITLFRISTLPTVFFIIMASKDYRMRFELVGLVGLVFITDSLDGIVSRRNGEKTRVGAMMDSAGDYALLFVISFVFYYFHIIPAWFMAVLSVRLGGQGLMMLTILLVRKSIEPRTSFMGKVAVASTMVLYVLELLRFVADFPLALYRTLEYGVGLILVVSIVDKVVLMIRELEKPALHPERAVSSYNDGEPDGND